MTILTAGACSFIVSSSGHVIPAAVGTAAGAVVTGVKLWVQTEPVKVALSTAVGTGTSSGAIAGAIASKTATSAAAGALLGGISAAGIGSMMAGGLAVASGVVASNPIGLLAVGTSHTEEKDRITYDCWKPVLHDTSLESSNGMILKDLVCHPNIANVTVTPSVCLPQIVIENVWNEKFEIEYVVQDSDKLSCHARPMLN
ncbi:uncharacterized protein LOC123548313 [Mercenaria mercenaria]|uniref:uncharacterized protein LOC123548313 n=1 Tax=Mercenaria mercenaria TaxID=6596 RepID=UPI00234E52F5|nr:uncharacterized protein LOC123548313 [Mercenaria mercenaria]XP_053380741.1 uncharacterized protein LOC123548313 [Mercenaria mercenaria]